MEISVIVPSYHRADYLEQCLKALSEQKQLPDEILVVCRAEDETTLTAIERGIIASSTLRPVLRIVFVSRGGMVAALNAGLEEARGEIMCFTDDDAQPWPDWTQRIAAHFMADPRVGGVGGRDWVYSNGVLDENPKLQSAQLKVGELTCFGRAIGNHHIGVGGAREVQFLKGADMSYRRAAIGEHRFDERLRGSGAQVCCDMAFGLFVRRQGWKLIYDPAVGVDHFPAPRFDSDARSGADLQAARNRIHNETLVIFEHLSSPRRALFLLWAALCGTKISPGIGLLPLSRLARVFGILRFGRVALGGRIAGLRSHFASARNRSNT